MLERLYIGGMCGCKTERLMASVASFLIKDGEAKGAVICQNHQYRSWLLHRITDILNEIGIEPRKSHMRYNEISVNERRVLFLTQHDHHRWLSISIDKGWCYGDIECKPMQRFRTLIRPKRSLKGLYKGRNSCMKQSFEQFTKNTHYQFYFGDEIEVRG